MAQELLGTFGEALGGVSLVPSSGGIFEVRADGELVWSRKEKGRFPEIKELKRAVRDAVCPGMEPGPHGFALRERCTSRGIVFDNCAGRV